MMAKFQGKWVDDPSAPRMNYKEMFDKIGMDEETKQKYTSTTTTIEYIVDGDKFKAITSSSAFQGLDKTFTYTLGEPFEDTSYDGSPFKATVTLIGDDTLYEVGENEKYGQFEFTRQVEGNIMNVTGNMAGVKMSSQMKKVY